MDYAEPDDNELARRVAALSLPSAHPVRRWEEFVRYFDESSLNTSTLQRWLGHPVFIGELETRPGPVLGAEDGQHRFLTLVARIEGQQLTVCRAESQVRLDLLPDWARSVLTQTRQPLGRTLHRVGATRDRSRPELHDPQPEDPDEPALTVHGTFRMPTNGGPPVALVRESFTPRVLAHRTDDLGDQECTDRQLDDIDGSLVKLIQRRRALTSVQGRPHGVAPPVYPVHDELLRMQLCSAIGRERGAAIFRAITGADPTRTVTAVAPTQLSGRSPL